MAISTVEGFLDALEKSRLLDEPQLAEARQIASQAADGKTLARALVQKGLLSRWQAAQLLAGRTTVFFLGKYKLIEMLGRGGMGGVFLAQHTMMNRRVALKVVSKQIAQDPAALEQFLAEARAIAALDHPNIVRAYNVDCEDGRYYLVMEYVEGKDLQRLVEEEGPLDFQKVVDYIRQAADGLAHAHQHNLIHCDIKPSNLLVTPDGVVKILDLGLARWGASAAEQKEKETDPRLVGTVDYQAPEVGLGEKVDARADIYSLGCTMFFLLTGKPPFGEGTLHERILKHQTQQPPDIASLRPGAPKDLVAICRKMMAKKPADRFQSAEEISKLLARWRPPQPKLRKAVPLEQTDSAAKISNSSSKIEVGIEPLAAKAAKARTEAGLEVKAESKETKAVAQPTMAGSGLAQTPPWVWIAGGAGAVVLVGLVIVWLVLAASSGTQPTAKTKREAGVLGPKVQQEEPPPWLPQTQQTGIKENPSSPTPEPEKPPTATPGQQEPPPQQPSKTPPEQPSPKSEKPPADQPKPQPTPKDKPETSQQPKAEPGPNEKPQPKEKPSEKPPQKQPPEKPKPQPEKKLPPVRGDFWDDKKNPKLVVKLPDLDQTPTQPIFHRLGKLEFEDIEARWFLDLVGGNLVLKGTQQFRMGDRRRTDNGFTWDVFLQKGPEGGEAKPVAQFEYKLDAKELWFHWLPGAEPESANLLRNCVLDINYRAETFPIYLRCPEQVPPLELQPLKPMAKPLTFKLAAVPSNPERLLWHFHRVDDLQEPPEWKNLKELEGLKYKATLEPPAPSPVDPKKQFLMKLLRIDRANNEHPDIIFQIMPQATGSRFQLSVRLVKPRPQDLRKIPPIEQATNFRKMADDFKKKLDEDAKKEPKHRMPEKERSEHLTKINLADAQAWFIKMQHLLEKGVTIHYRLVYDLGRYQILLAESTSPPPAEKK